MDTYDHKKIEKKWQKIWKEQKLYETPDETKDKENYYQLVEFPYPSGNLHIGHWYAFAVPDIHARYKRMKGFNVLYPFGFDSFGLPAENAAIQRKLDPGKWTASNIEYMKGQVASMGGSFDWSREIRTSDPAYYKWTQYIFTKLFEAGLAYQKEALVNWCPSCNTVLANEQVVNGACERCDTEIEKRNRRQWFLRITDYVERLLSGLEDLSWPEEIKESQRNWIGKSEGAEIDFEITFKKNPADNNRRGPDGKPAHLPVFTTRPDTLYGATYLVLAPEHPWVRLATDDDHDVLLNKEAVRGYVQTALVKTEIERTSLGKEKTGVELLGVKAINPATGEEIPMYVADYVLSDYGTGTVMAVPAHDERDFAFAKERNLSIKYVVLPSGIDFPIQSFDGVKSKYIFKVLDGAEIFLQQGYLVNSGVFNGMSSQEAAEKIIKKYGVAKTTYKLRDWSVGRQRYWGCPIPIVYSPKGEPHVVPVENLPWVLPSDVDHTPDGSAPLDRSKELTERTEKIFGKGWSSEVDTLDTFVDSSWYFLRYLDPHNKKELCSSENQKKWMPIDFYSGGAEHTTMHLLYSRFFYKAMRDLGLVSGNVDEPYTVRLNRGLILGPDGQKMSKSKGNVVDPDEQVANVGADVVRMYLGFIGPYNQAGTYPWDMGGIVGIRRFLERIWNMRKRISEEKTSLETEKELHKLIKKVGDDIQALKFNTATSAFMSFINLVEKVNYISRVQFETLLILLAPFAPHISEEMWYELGNETSIHRENWPTFDEKFLVDDVIELPVQINGKTRFTLDVSPDIDEVSLKEMVLADPRARKWIKSEKVRRFVYIRAKIVNVVL